MARRSPLRGQRRHPRAAAAAVMALAAGGSFLVVDSGRAAADTTASFTKPGVYPFTVPAGVASITVTAIGAAGGSLAQCDAQPAGGGQGAEVTATLAVTPGEALLVGVGAVGGDAICGQVSGGAGGSNGGGGIPGSGGNGGNSPEDTNPGAGGGGASLVTPAATPKVPLIVAGGGGGEGLSYNASAKGGDAGTAGSGSGGPKDATPGGGGTAKAGGDGGVGGTGGDTCTITNDNGGAGSQFIGGNGGSGDVSGDANRGSGGGGGGGGYFGGGGGGGSCESGAGGGGGSSFVAQGALVAKPVNDAASVTISYLAPPPVVAYVPPAPPVATITVPASDPTYAVGQVVDDAFTCTDGIGAPGIASCADQNGSPSGAPLDTSTTGAHTLTVTATSKDGETATATATYQVADPPVVTITAPLPAPAAPTVAPAARSALSPREARYGAVMAAPSGSAGTRPRTVTTAVYRVGALVNSVFTCTDGTGGPGIASCVDQNGSPEGAPVDTSTPGLHTLVVTGTSRDGLSTTARVTYLVADPPTATITVPTAGATFALSQVVASSFACAEGLGGTGIASCTDQNGRPTGAPLDTSAVGTHTVTVTAVSYDGLTGTAAVTYRITATAAPGPNASATTASATSPPTTAPTAAPATPATTHSAATGGLAVTGAPIAAESSLGAGLVATGGALMAGGGVFTRRRRRCR